MFTVTIDEAEAKALLEALYANKQAMSVMQSHLDVAKAKQLLETLHNLTETSRNEFI